MDPSTQGFVDLKGKVADFFCNHEPPQDGNGMREKWGVARVGAEFKVEPLESAKMRELDALFGKQLKAAFGAAPVQRQQAAVAALEVTDDDVPF